MQQPDENGYIQVDWPSKNIPYGGIFHAKKVEATPERVNFLKLLLEESKLSIAQRKKDAWRLRENDDNGGRKTESRVRAPIHPSLRPHTSKRRSLSSIRASGDLNIEKYRPIQRIEDRDLMKKKLQEVMEWGKEGRPKKDPENVKPPPEPPALTPRSKRREYIEQIRERAEWLAEMEALGQAGPHRDVIRDQIAERMRAIHALGLDVESEAGTARSVIDEVLEPAKTSARSYKGKTGESKGSSARTVRSTGGSSMNLNKTKRSISVAPRIKAQHENISMMECLSSLRKSPRRRC